MIKKNWRPFKEARKFVRGLHLDSEKEWRKWHKKNRPIDLPYSPYNTYKDEWIGMGDWLGTGRISTQNRKYRPFKEARKFVRGLHLKSTKEWEEYSKTKRPFDIPGNTGKVYKIKGWKGSGDSLGTGTVAPQKMKFRSLEECKKFVEQQKITKLSQWQKFAKSKKRPHDIPGNPNQHYKGKGWISWGDFFGTGYVHPMHRKFLPFKEARSFVRNLG